MENEDLELQKKLLREYNQNETIKAKEEDPTYVSPQEQAILDSPDPTVQATNQQIDANQELLDKFEGTQSLEKVVPGGEAFTEAHTNMEVDWNPAKWAYMAGMGALDVPFDVVGAVPGLGGIDDTWDDVTKFANPEAQQFRSIASVIIPSIIVGGKYHQFHQARNLTGLNGAVQNVGGQMLINGVIGAISDYGENPDNRFITSPENFKKLAEVAPWFAGPGGMFPTIGDLQDADATHPMVNRILAGLDEGILQGVGDLIGYGLNAGKPILHKFIPRNDLAKQWKATQQFEHIEIDTRNRIIDFDAAINSGALSPQQIEALELEKAKLIKQTLETGASEVTENAGDSFIKARQNQRQNYLDNKAIKSIAADPESIAYDPAITPKLASPKNLAGNTAQPPGAVVHNVLDVDGQLSGAIDDLGVPTSPITDAMKDAMLLGPNSRKAIAHIAKQVEAAGDYNLIQGAFRTSRKVAAENVYKVYEQIMKPGTGDALRALLKDRTYRDTKGLRDALSQKIEITYLDEEAKEAAALAINDLINLYLGREITESSARVMHTLGKEISAKAGAPVKFQNLLDEEQVFKNILDRMEILEIEYGTAKYVAGWQLNNTKWWQYWQNSTDPGEIARVTFEEFGSKTKEIRDRWKVFRAELEKAAEIDPKLARTLMNAYDHSDGKVDTLIKLNKFIDYHLNPGGLMYNKEAADLGISGWQMNQFAKGAWGVTYNSVLSGLSSLRAAVGNGSMLILKPISAFTRAGVRSALTRDLEPLERATYMYGAMFETASRAWGDALTRIKKVHSDADFVSKAARRDFVIQDSNTWEILDGAAETYLTEDNPTRNFLYGWANFQRKLAKTSWLRTGITAMSGVDAFTDTFMATYYSRLSAYEDVFNQYGKTLDPEKFQQLLKQAEEVNYGKMFDKQGMLTDAAAKNASGEIALNLDDGFTKFMTPALNKMPFLKSLMMFPRTAMNQVKVGLSYTPISLIPGISKYGDVLTAGDNIDLIKKALFNHGIKNFDETPNALAIYKSLKDEYQGRLMMGMGTASLAYMYALGGGIRGNGPANHSELVKLKKRGWKPNTIKIGNNWVSYKGVPMLETWLSLMGDMAYSHTALGTNLVEDNLSKIGWTITATWLNGTPLYGMEPLHAALRGDEGAFKRLIAGQVRAAIPLSGAHAVVAKGITNAQKEIYNDFWGYVRNNTIFKDMSYSKIDHWTGDEIDEIDNPFLRMLNAINPVKIHGGNEPWRLWLLESGFDDIAEIKVSSKGVEYSPEERELIGIFMGKQQLWKQVDALSKSKQANTDLDKLRQFINGGAETEEINEFRNQLPLYRKLKQILNEGKNKAEQEIAADPKYRHLDILGLGKQRVKQLMQQNEIEEAAKQAKKNYATKQLLQIAK